MSKKLWQIVLACLVALLVLGAGYGVHVSRRGFSAREQPSSMEAFLATTARSLALPPSYLRPRNPVPASADSR